MTGLCPPEARHSRGMRAPRRPHAAIQSGQAQVSRHAPNHQTARTCLNNRAPGCLILRTAVSADGSTRHPSRFGDLPFRYNSGMGSRCEHRVAEVTVRRPGWASTAVTGRAAGGRLTAAGWPIRCCRYSYLHPWLADSVVGAAVRGFGPWWTRNVRGMLRTVAPAAQRGCCGPEERPYADVPKSAHYGSRGPRLSQFQRGLS